MTWFWSTPEWEKYSAAYGAKTDNISPNGNLVVRLGPEKEMWSRIRKGHQADIRHAEKTVAINYENYDPARLAAEYQALHMLDAGRLTRPQETFDLMASWVPKFASIEIGHVGEPLAAAYFIRYERGMYYASAARHPNAPRGIAHLLIWAEMLGAAMCNTADWLDLGPVPAEDASDKEKSIAHFKRGFGAERRMWPY